MTVTLSAPMNAALGTSQALVTIQNDDAAAGPTSTYTPTSTPVPTQTPTPVPTFAVGPQATTQPVRVSRQRAGQGRLLVTIAASGPISRITWTSVANVAVEISAGVPITGGSLAPPQGSTTAVFYVRKADDDMDGTGTAPCCWPEAPKNAPGELVRGYIRKIAQLDADLDLQDTKRRDPDECRRMFKLLSDRSTELDATGRDDGTVPAVAR